MAAPPKEKKKVAELKPKVKPRLAVKPEIMPAAKRARYKKKVVNEINDLLKVLAEKGYEVPPRVGERVAVAALSPERVGVKDREGNVFDLKATANKLSLTITSRDKRIEYRIV